MLKIGLTGGIGSGKSTVARVFRVLNIPVYDSDREAKRLMNESADIRKALLKRFGEAVYQDDGNINKGFLAQEIFHNKAAMNYVNNTVHPVVQADFKLWANRLETAGYNYLIKEAAILFESQSHLDLDHTIMIFSPEEIRLQRVMNRDAVSRDAVRQRMANQWPDEKKCRLADTIIYNDDTQLLIPQVLKLDQKWRS